MKPWKSEWNGNAYATGDALQWGHGDEAVEEATWGIKRAPSVMLQWGHGDEAVEELLLQAVFAAVTGASMGPRR